jgi:hypothetical protein
MKTSNRRLHPIVTIMLQLAVLLAIANKSFGTIYYISTTGSDATGTGSKASPWRSLFKATAAVNRAGDTIFVNAGIYTETAQSVLKAGINIQGASATNTAIRSTLSGQFVEIISVRSPSEGGAGNQFISGITFDGQNRTTSWAIAVFARSNVNIHDCVFKNFDESAVLFIGRTDLNLDVPPTFYSTNNKFYNNLVTNCSKADGLYGRGAVWCAGQQGTLIYNNTLTQNSRGAGNDGYLIKLINFTKGVKIYGNTITKSPYPYAASGTNNFWDFAIEIGDVTGCEIYNNTIQGSIDMNRLTKGTYPYSMYIHNNTIGFNSLQANPEHGILVEYGSEAVIIDSNIIKYVATAIEFDTRSQSMVKDIRISRNLIHNTGMIGGTGMAVLTFVTDGNNNYNVRNFFVWNNTIHSDPSGSNYYGLSFSNAASIKNLRIENNIGQNITNMIVSNWANTIDSFYHRNNNWYNNGNNNNPLWVTGTPTNTITAANTNINPNLDVNFKPLAGSPLIDAGLITGLSYTGAAPDKGYAEYASLLPVVLTELSVTHNQGTNTLQWKTASEQNSSYFMVQRSSDGIKFENVGTVAAAGNSSGLKTYTFKDETPHSYVNYYRIIIVDRDNSKEYSSVVLVKADNDKLLDIVAAEVNGNSRNFNVTIATKKDQLVLMSVVDNNGRALFNERLILKVGTNFYKRNMQQAATGIYYVRLQTTKQSIAKTVLNTN